MINWQLLTMISALWLGITINTVAKGDLVHAMIYGGIFITNTGFVFDAIH